MRRFGNVVVVPFEAWHLEWIDFNEDAARALASVVQDMPNHGRLLATSSKAFTALCKGRVLGCAGLIPWWEGMAELWMYLGKDAFIQRKQAVKILRWYMDHLIKDMKLHRIQAVVKTEFKEGHRFAKFFGFVNEGNMENYSAAKDDFTRYARIIK